MERVLSRVFEAIIEQTVTDALTAAEKQIEVYIYIRVITVLMNFMNKSHANN